MNKHPEYKQRLMKEISPPVAAVKDNIVEQLTYDKVMEFDYLMMCYSESLRIEPPIASSTYLSQDQDSLINVGNGETVLLRKDKPYAINMRAIHYDERQWIQPTVYRPDRFDYNNESKWTKAANG